jgi:hypothetical protein
MMVPMATKHAERAVDGSNPYLDTLRVLFKYSADDAMMDQLKRLEPFPESRLFQDLNRQLQVWRQSLSLQDHLQDFVCSETLKRHLASSAASSLALQHLDSMLMTHGSALESMIAAAASDENVAKLLYRTVSKLFQLNSFSQDEKTLQLAASCLGRIGPINVHSVTIGVEETDLMSPRLTENWSLSHMHVELVSLVSQFLFDEDLEVISCAMETLRQLFGTAAADAVFWTKLTELYTDRVWKLKILSPFKPRKSHAQAGIGSTSTIVNPLEWSDAFDAVWTIKGKSYEKWICELAHHISEMYEITDLMLRGSGILAKSKPELAGKLLPFLILDICISESTKSVAGNASGMGVVLSTQFRDHVLLNVDDSPCGQAAVRAFLSVVDVLRTYRLSIMAGIARRSAARDLRDVKEAISTWPSEIWLEIDYRQIARAAMKCGAYFSALMMLEADRIAMHKSLLPLPAEQSDGIESNLLVEVFKNINERDSLYAVNTSPEIISRTVMYSHERDWSKALAGFDSLLQNPELDQATHAIAQDGLLCALRKSGLEHLLQSYLTSTNAGADSSGPSSSWYQFRPAVYAHGAILQRQHESAWRLGQWNTRNERRLELDRSIGPSFDSTIHSAIVAMQDGDLRRLNLLVNKEQVLLMKQTSGLTRQSSLHIHSNVCRLGMLQCILDAADVGHRAQSTTTQGEIKALQNKWNRQIQLVQDEFELAEPLLRIQRILFEILGAPRLAASHQHLLVANARRQGVLSLAMNEANRLRNLSPTWTGNGANSEAADWIIEEAKVFWARQETSTALQLVRSVVSDFERKRQAHLPPADGSRYARALRTLGKWLVDTRSESKSSIDHILGTVLKLATTYNGNVAKAHFALADFLDRSSPCQPVEHVHGVVLLDAKSLI